jgi:hypothetical protein
MMEAFLISVYPYLILKKNFSTIKSTQIEIETSNLTIVSLDHIVVD